MINLSILKEQILKEENSKKIIEIKNIFVKEHLSPLYEQLKVASDKKALGQEINKLKEEIEAIVKSRINELELKDEDNVHEDLDIELDVFNVGTPHIINKVIEDISQYLSKFDFNIATSSEVVSDYFNFEALNIPKNHPARNMHDSLFIENNLLLRTHCTSTTAMFLASRKDNQDIRVYSYGNVYRKDEDDATHSHQFTQLDLVWVKDGLSLANLKYIINGLVKHLFGETLDVRYRLSYFPFTEPSFEVDVECWKCRNKGCNICKNSGWIEVLGAGMLNQQVIREAGIKKINTGIAAGIGIERIAMLKYGISDIRDFYNNDFDFIKQFPK